MTRVTLMGKDLTDETEVFHTDYDSTEEVGFDAIITYNDGYTLTMYNITEVHYLYKSTTNKKQCALESDIHSSGQTIDLEDNRVKSIMIIPSEYIHPTLYSRVLI